MTRKRLLDLFENLYVWKRRGIRAPHKPLLLLLALGRVLDGRERLVPYTQIENSLKELLRRFGPPRKAFHPEFPFNRLRNDKLWEVPGSEILSRTASRDFLVGELREHGIKGGFPEWAYELLRNDSEIAREAAQGLLDAHFPESLHDQIRVATGIPYPWKVRETPARRRDPAFRREVLREYEYRCAVCNFDVRLGDDLIGLEAAHIMWVAAGGPDKVANGLALCGLHHKALDRGAFGLEAIGANYRVLISSEVHGQSDPIRWFLDYHDKPLRPPRNRRLDPDPEYVNWHRREVFRPPPLG
ncbi:MAG: HNH endonuclease [Acidobacteriota bacterium]|nr:HNH endonuclease [Acidobacteriota bacterium]